MEIEPEPKPAGPPGEPAPPTGAGAGAGSASASGRHRLTIEDASAWVLRVGVVTSVLVMLAGTVLSFIHGPPTVERMSHDRFDWRVAVIVRGIRAGRGKSVIEAGIYLLVLTPITRVVTSMILFAFVERDRLYAAITFIVLLLTLAGLLFLN